MGDCILTTHFLRKVCEKYDDICFDFHIGKQYLDRIKLQVGELSDRISLGVLATTPYESTNMWFAAFPLPKDKGKHRGRWASNERYDLFHEVVCEKWEIENPVPGKCCTVIDLPSLLDPVDVPCDVLVGNSISRSKYYTRYNAQAFEEKVKEWSKKYNVFTTEPTIEGVPSARELDLNVIQIGHMATKAKYVVAVDTGTVHNCFNKWALDTVEKWWLLSNKTTRTFNDRIVATNYLHKVDIP